MPRDDAEDRLLIFGSRRPHREFLSAAREKRLPHHRVLKEIEQIRGVAPQIRRGSPAQLRHERPVGEPPVRTILLRIIGSQFCRNGFTDSVMYMEPVPVWLHEGERPNPFLCVLWRRVREHGAQNR